MLFVTITFFIENDHERDVINILHKLMQQACTQAGVLENQAYRSQTEPGHFFIYYRFTDRDAFDAYRATANFGEYVMTDLYAMVDPDSFFIDRYAPLDLPVSV